MEKLEKLEAITENTLKKYGRVPDSPAEALASTQADYAVSKDNLHDLQGRELRGRGLVVCRDAGITLFHAPILQQTLATLKTFDLRALRHL